MLDSGKFTVKCQLLDIVQLLLVIFLLIVVGEGGEVQGTKWTRLSTTELLDTTNRCWYTCNNLPSPHQQIKAAIMNDKLYLLGGVDKDLEPSSQVFVASLDTLSTHQLKWKSTLNTPSLTSAPVVLYNKFLFTVGGRKSSDFTSQTSEVYALNPKTGQWKHLTNIPAARSYPAAVIMDDKMIVANRRNDQ